MSIGSLVREGHRRLERRGATLFGGSVMKSGLTGCALFLSFFVVGCAQEKESVLRLYRKHLVAFDTDGTPLNPNSHLRGWRVGKQRMTSFEYGEQLKHIATEIKREAQQRKKFEAVVVFIHGGLNGYGSSLERAQKRSEQMLREGYYPIFVAWNSSLLSSYGDNLFYTRGRFNAWLIPAVFYLIPRDLIAGTLNIVPRFLRGSLDVAERLYYRGPNQEGKLAASIASGALSAYEAYCEKMGDYERNDARAEFVERMPIPISVGSFRAEGLKDFYRYSVVSPAVLTSPVRGATSFLVDSFGKGAWEGMLRRVKLLFESDGQRQQKATNVVGLSRLMLTLRRVQASIKRGELHHERSETIRGLEWLRAGLARFLARSNNPRYKLLYASFLRLANSLLDEVEEISPQKLLQLLQGLKEPRKDPLGDKVLSFVKVSFFLLFESEEVADVLENLRPAWDVIQEFITRFIARNDVNIGQVLEKRMGNKIQDLGELQLIARYLLFELEEILADLRREELQVRLMAHSMGAIVANEILERSERYETPRFKHIVFMAAACTVKDYEETTIPYLRKHKGYGTQLFHVLLHPEAEREESMFVDVLPRGSLLVYIDDYLTEPHTPRDRTVGRFENLMLSLMNTPSDVTDQLSVKVLPAGNGLEGRDSDDIYPKRPPEGHGEFTPQEFWRDEFYMVDDRCKPREATSSE